MTPSRQTPFADWPARLAAAAASTHGRIARMHVVREIGSTQDEARRLDLPPGEAVIAWRQTAGRGRLDRAWADTGEDGVAVTVALGRAPSARLSLLGAVATAIAIENVLARSVASAVDRPPPVGIKWPNDIVVAGRKLAGVLIEQSDGVALMGVGVNVTQRGWPAELAASATSIAEVVTSVHRGCDDGSAPVPTHAPIDRIDVVCALLRAIAAALDLDDATLVAEFHARDALTGSTRTLRCGDERVAGTIVEIDPMRHLRVRRADGAVVTLPAALTQLER